MHSFETVFDALAPDYCVIRKFIPEHRLEVLRSKMTYDEAVKYVVSNELFFENLSYLNITCYIARTGDPHIRIPTPLEKFL